LSEGLLYLDSSALVKLVLPEAETRALLGALSDWPERISSTIAGVEVLRAVRHAGAGERVRERAERVISGIGLVRVDEAVLSGAARLEPAELRTLDAIHLATALSAGEDLGAMICYDDRLAQAAARLGVTMMAPGAKD
jgi:predicted nucleic acid-binding protein